MMRARPAMGVLLFAACGGAEPRPVERTAAPPPSSTAASPLASVAASPLASIAASPPESTGAPHVLNDEEENAATLAALEHKATQLGGFGVEAPPTQRAAPAGPTFRVKASLEAFASMPAPEATMKAIRDVARRCYQQALAEDPSQGGRARVAVTFGPTGAVATVQHQRMGHLRDSLLTCIDAGTRRDVRGEMALEVSLQFERYP